MEQNTWESQCERNLYTSVDVLNTEREPRTGIILMCLQVFDTFLLIELQYSNQLLTTTWATSIDSS